MSCPSCSPTVNPVSPSAGPFVTADSIASAFQRLDSLTERVDLIDQKLQESSIGDGAAEPRTHGDLGPHAQELVRISISQAIGREANEVCSTSQRVLELLTQLLHDSSSSSVSRDSEGSGAAGSASSDSAAPFDNRHHRESLERVAKTAQHLAENYCGKDSEFIDPADALATYLRRLGHIADVAANLRREFESTP